MITISDVKALLGSKGQHHNWRQHNRSSVNIGTLNSSVNTLLLILYYTRLIAILSERIFIYYMKILSESIGCYVHQLHNTQIKIKIAGLFCLYWVHCLSQNYEVARPSGHAPFSWQFKFRAMRSWPGTKMADSEMKHMPPLAILW